MPGTRTGPVVVCGLLGCFAAALAFPTASTSQPPEKADPPDEPTRLNEMIEKSVSWYDVYPEEGAAALSPVPVIRWRNVIRGQVGEAMMVVWPHHGRPVAMASIYPWMGKMSHEFDSLSRGNKLVAKDKDRVIWAPEAAGVEFKDVPAAPRPAKSPAERLRQMKAIAERFQAIMTGWLADNSDREMLRLLPRPLYRYDLAAAKAPEPSLLDGALFAYVQGTDPEIVLVLEAVGAAENATWQYAFVRATSAGLEVRIGGEVIWTAEKAPPNRRPNLPHFTMQRDLTK